MRLDAICVCATDDSPDGRKMACLLLQNPQRTEFMSCEEMAKTYGCHSGKEFAIG